MTLIDALLLLQEHGEPTMVGQNVAAVLAGSSDKIVQRCGAQWSLTEGGCRFLAQFRERRSDSFATVVVRIAIENDAPVFHLLCDDAVLLKVEKADLRRRLHDLHTANPNVKVLFDFRPLGRVS
jgi:hypothetical protein